MQSYRLGYPRDLLRFIFAAVHLTRRRCAPLSWWVSLRPLLRLTARTDGLHTKYARQPINFARSYARAWWTVAFRFTLRSDDSSVRFLLPTPRVSIIIFYRARLWLKTLLSPHFLSFTNAVYIPHRCLYFLRCASEYWDLYFQPDCKSSYPLRFNQAYSFRPVIIWYIDRWSKR